MQVDFDLEIKELKSKYESSRLKSIKIKQEINKKQTSNQIKLVQLTNLHRAITLKLQEKPSHDFHEKLFKTQFMKLESMNIRMKKRIECKLDGIQVYENLKVKYKEMQEYLKEIESKLGQFNGVKEFNGIANLFSRMTKGVEVLKKDIEVLTRQP